MSALIHARTFLIEEMRRMEISDLQIFLPIVSAEENVHIRSCFVAGWTREVRTCARLKSLADQPRDLCRVDNVLISFDVSQLADVSVQTKEGKC